MKKKGWNGSTAALISKDHDHLSDWYLKLNPNGVVPTLIHDGRPVYESSVIVQYLDQIHPDTALVPADAYGQAQMRAWIAYVDMATTPAIRYPSFQFGGLLLKFQALSDEEFAKKAEERPTKAAFYRKMDKQKGFAGGELEQAFADVRATAARMDQMLEESGGPVAAGRAIHPRRHRRGAPSRPDRGPRVWNIFGRKTIPGSRTGCGQFRRGPPTPRPTITAAGCRRSIRSSSWDADPIAMCWTAIRPSVPDADHTFRYQSR